MVAWWCSKANKIWLRILALVVSSIFFFTQVVGASVPDRSFWRERRKARQKLLSSREKSQQSDRRKGLGKKLEEKDVAGEVSSLITPHNLFTVPSQYGTVKEVHTQATSKKPQGIGNRLIIHIQDAHSSPEAQLNSANILKYLRDSLSQTSGVSSESLARGVSSESLTRKGETIVSHSKPNRKQALPLLICVEGSSSLVDTTLLSTFPEKKIKEKVASEFLKEGKITGEEYFAIIQDDEECKAEALPESNSRLTLQERKTPGQVGVPGVTIYGVEDKRAYEKNLKAFDESIASGERLRNYFQKVREEINPLKDRLYNKRLKELESKIESYQKKIISLTHYSRYLHRLSNSAVGAKPLDRPGSQSDRPALSGATKVAPSRAQSPSFTNAKYPNFELFVEASKLENKIDFSKVDSERSKYIKELSKKLTNDELSDLLIMSLDYRLGKVTSAEYYTYLQSLSSKMRKGMRSEDPRILTELVTSKEGKNEYPNLNSYIKYNKLYDRIDQNKLFSEISELEQELKERLCQREEERKLVRLSRMLDVLQDLTRFKISNEDLAYYYKHRDEITPGMFSDFITAHNGGAPLRGQKNVGLALRGHPKESGNVDATFHGHPKGDVGTGRSSTKGIVAGPKGLPPAVQLLRSSSLRPATLSKFEEFYRIALERNQALVDNTISRMEKEGVTVAVLIAGGFHTPGITELLRDKNMSYVVVTPRLGENYSSDLEPSPRKKRSDLEKAIAGIVGAIRAAHIFGDASFQRYAVICLGANLTVILSSQFKPEEIERASQQLISDWKEELRARGKSTEVIDSVEFFSVVLTRDKEAFVLGVVRIKNENLPFVFRYDVKEEAVREIIRGDEGCRDFLLSGPFDNGAEVDVVSVVYVQDKLKELWDFLQKPDSDIVIATALFGKGESKVESKIEHTAHETVEAVEGLAEEGIMEEQAAVPSSSFIFMPLGFLRGFFDSASQFFHNITEEAVEQTSSIASHLSSGNLPLDATPDTILPAKLEIMKQLATFSPYYFIPIILIPTFIILGVFIFTKPKGTSTRNWASHIYGTSVSFLKKLAVPLFSRKEIVLSKQEQRDYRGKSLAIIGEDGKGAAKFFAPFVLIFELGKTAIQPILYKIDLVKNVKLIVASEYGKLKYTFTPLPLFGLFGFFSSQELIKNLPQIQTTGIGVLDVVLICLLCIVSWPIYKNVIITLIKGIIKSVIKTAKVLQKKIRQLLKGKNNTWLIIMGSLSILAYIFSGDAKSSISLASIFFIGGIWPGSGRFGNLSNLAFLDGSYRHEGRDKKARLEPAEKKLKAIIEEINRDVHEILRPRKCKSDDIERALELLDGSLDCEPENPHTLCNYAFAYIKLSHFDPRSECLKKALSYAKKCLQVRPKFLRGYFLTAWILCRQGEYDKAFDINAQGLEKSPNHRNLLHQRIRMLVDVRRYGEALPLCERHLRVHPYDLPVFEFLWICQHNLGMSEEAKKTCRTALKMGEDPRRKRVWLKRLKGDTIYLMVPGSTPKEDSAKLTEEKAAKAFQNFASFCRKQIELIRKDFEAEQYDKIGEHIGIIRASIKREFSEFPKQFRIDIGDALVTGFAGMSFGPETELFRRAIFEGPNSMERNLIELEKLMFVGMLLDAGKARVKSGEIDASIAVSEAIARTKTQPQIDKEAISVVLEGIHANKSTQTPGTKTLFQKWEEKIEAVTNECRVYKDAIQAKPGIQEDLEALLKHLSKENNIIIAGLIEIAERAAKKGMIDFVRGDIVEFVTKQYEEFREVYDYDILHPAYVGHDVEVCNIVNPNHEEGKIAVYGASYADIHNYLLSLDAQRGYFVDEVPVSKSALEQAKKDWDSIDTSIQDGYIKEKRFQGFISHYERQEIALHIIQELKAIGVERDDIEIYEVDSNGNRIESADYYGNKYATISFRWKYPGTNEARPYTITFIENDITKPGKYKPILKNKRGTGVLDKGIDYYYQRGGSQIPKSYNYFIRTIGKAIKTGGFCITDDYTGTIGGSTFPCEIDEYFKEDRMKFDYADMSSSALGLFASAIFRLRESRNFPLKDYGWHVRIRKKLWDGNDPESIKRLKPLKPKIMLGILAVIFSIFGSQAFPMTQTIPIQQPTPTVAIQKGEIIHITKDNIESIKKEISIVWPTFKELTYEDMDRHNMKIFIDKDRTGGYCTSNLGKRFHLAKLKDTDKHSRLKYLMHPGSTPKDDSAKPTEERAAEAFRNFASFCREQMRLIEKCVEAGEYKKVVEFVDTVRDNIEKVFPKFIEIIEDVILIDIVGISLLSPVERSSRERALNILNNINRNLEEFEKLISAGRLSDAKKALVKSGKIDASQVLGPLTSPGEAESSDPEPVEGASARTSKGDHVAFEPFLVVTCDFGAESRRDIEKSFGVYFDESNLRYRAIFENNNVFKIAINSFLNSHEHTKWLEDDGREDLILAMYEKYKRYATSPPTRITQAKEEFFKELMWLLELGRNVETVLNNQVEPALADAGMKDLMTKKVSFTYNERSEHAMYFNKKGVLLINLAVYDEASRRNIIGSLRFNILFHFVERYQMENDDSFAKSKAPAGGDIADKYLHGKAFDRTKLSKQDQAKIERLLTRVVSEWTAFILSFDKNIRNIGIRMWLADAWGRLQTATPKEAALEVAATSAIVEVTEYQQDDKNLVCLINHVLPEEDYFATLKEEFLKYLEAIELKNDLRIRVVSQEEFDKNNPTIAGQDFYYSRRGVAFIVDKGDKDEIDARKAQARMIHRYYYKLQNVPSEVHKAVELFKKDLWCKKVIEKTIALMGSSYPAKRAEDVLYGRYGRFDNVALEGEEEFLYFMPAQRIVKLIEKKFEREEKKGSHEPLVFIIKHTPGRLATFEIFTIDSKFNKEKKIKYTMRGLIGREKKQDGKYSYWTTFYGYDTRSPVRFMQQHGWQPHNLKEPRYTEDELTEATIAEMIVAARIFIEGGLPLDTKTNMIYCDKYGDKKQELNRPLLDLACCSVHKSYLYPPPYNHPDYVPQTIITILGEMLARHSYLKVKQTRRKTLSAEEKDFLATVESLAVLPQLLELFSSSSKSEDKKSPASKKEQGNELLIDFTSFWKGNKHFIPIIKNKKCLKGHKFYKQALNGSDSFEGIKPIFQKLIKDEGLSKENVKIKVLDFDPDPTVTANVLYMKDGRKVIVINKAFVRMIAFQLMNGYQDIILEDKETNKKSDLVTSEVYSIAIHELRAHLKLGLFDERVAQYHRGEKYKDINVAAMIYSWSMSLKEFDLYKIKGFVEDNPHLVPVKYRSYYIRQVKDIDDQRIIDNQGEIRNVPIPRPSEYQFAKITELKHLVYSQGLKKYMKDFTDYDEDILEYERLKLRADYIVGDEGSDQDDRKPSSEEETPAIDEIPIIDEIEVPLSSGDIAEAGLLIIDDIEGCPEAHKRLFKCRPETPEELLAVAKPLGFEEAASWRGELAEAITEEVLTENRPRTEKVKVELLNRQVSVESRRKFLRNVILCIVGKHLVKGTPLMAKDSKKAFPEKISLESSVTPIELERYRFPFAFLFEVETLYDMLAWQKRLVASGEPLELGPGYIYHGWTNLDDAIIKGKVIAEVPLESMLGKQDHILRSFLTRLPHKWALWGIEEPDSNSPAIYMINTKEFNRLANEGKASLDYTGGADENEDIIDPYPNIFDSFSLDIVSEIWVREDDYKRYKNLVNVSEDKLSKRERKLRQNLIPLIEKDIIKPIPFLSCKTLKGTDETERFLLAGDCIGQWMARRGLFEKIPLFKAKDEPLPKDEPLTPHEAILKFLSDLPEGLSPEDIVKRFYDDENCPVMKLWFSLLPYSLSLFKDLARIFNMWVYTLKTPREMEARAKEILQDDELVRLFMLIKRYREDDFGLEYAVFVSEDVRKAIKKLMHKDYGVNILVEDILGALIISNLHDESMRDAMISFISALEPKKLINSRLYFEDIKETDELSAEQALKYMDKKLISLIFWGQLLSVYDILRARGYTSEKAGELLADWSYYVGSVFRQIGIRDLLKDPEVVGSEKPILAERIADELIRRRRVFIEYKILSTLCLLIPVFLVGVLLTWLWMKYKDRYLASREGDGSNFPRQSGKRKKAKKKKRSQDRPASAAISPATQAKEWIRSVMQVALKTYKDEDFSVLLDRTIDVEGRPLTCVTDSKPFDANSPGMFVTAGSVKCSPIICQTKSKVKAFDNHLYHLPIGNENDLKDEKHLRYLDKYLGYIGDRESVVIIPFNEEFEDKYKKVSEYILNKHKNTKVLLIRTKSNTTKAGLVMREGIGIDVGEEEVGYLHVPAMPKEGTSRTLAMTWEEVYALLGSERSVVKDFEKLSDSHFSKRSGEMGQLPTEEAIREILKNLPDYVVSLASLLEHICKERPEMLEIAGIKTEDEQVNELVRICCKFNERDFEDTKAKDIINEATKKRIDFYRTVGQEAREFIAKHEDEFRKLGRKLEMITCQGHSFEVQRRLRRLGIKSKIFYRGDETGFHFWVVTEDGYIIDAYTSSAAYTSEENELLVLKWNQDIKNEYVGKEIGQLKKSIKTRIEKERKIWMGIAETVRAHQIYTDVYNKARNMVLSMNPDIEEAGITFACEIIKAIQECMKRLPEDKKIIIHFCTGDTPWIGYIKLAYYLKNWHSKEVQDILRAHGIKGEDLKLKPDMSRVEAYSLDAIFPQKRTAYHSFANVLNNMFDRLEIPKGQRHLFYGDIGEDGKPMSDEDFDRLMKDMEKNGLLIDDPNEIQAPFINAMWKHANSRSKEIEGEGGAHIFLAGFGPSYEGKAHIAFIKLITSFFKKAFIGSAPRDVTAAHAKENGGLGNFYVDGISKYGVISFGFYELLLRQGNPDIRDDVKVIAIATGNAKNSSVQKLVEGDYDENYPATGLQDSRGVVVLDQTSAASLRLHTHPWEFYHIDEWNDQLIKKFFIQLSLDTGKPIRELTVQDFLEQPTMGSDEIQKIKEYNLSTLGSWDDLKEQVIQEVKDAIATPEELDTKFRLPAKSRLVFISAHLDDDYFAMRDGIEALARKGHEVCAYYVTPGYNAVDDRYTVNILNHIKGWTKEQLIQYAKLNEEILTSKLSDLVEGQNLHQSPTDYDVWSHMGDEEKLLRAQLLFPSFNQRMNGMLTDKFKCDALINLLVGTLKNKETWGGKDIKLMCDIKTYIRTTEAKSAMMSLGLKYENIHVPLDPSWYITEERRPTASPEDIEKLKDILRYENRDGNLSMVIYNGEGFPDYAAHSTVEASVDTALRELIEKAERASIFGPMIRGVARRLGKWLPLGLAALLALVPLNLRIFKACQYTGVWERTATHQAQLSLLSTEDKLENFDRKSRQHYPSQSPPILADSGYETPYHFSEQVVINEIRTRGEVATLLGSKDTRKEWQPILRSPKAGILNYKILDFTDRAKRGELKEKLKKKEEELNKVRDAVDSTSDVARKGPAALPNIAAMKKEIQALKEAGISPGDVLSRDEFENQLHNAKQERHKVAAANALRIIDTASASHRLSRPGPGEPGDMQNDTRDWNKLTRAWARISFEELFASKLYAQYLVEALKGILALYNVDLSRSIGSVFRDREIKAYVKKRIQEILMDQFIASFYSRKGKNAGKWHVFGMGRLGGVEFKKEIDELQKIDKFFAEVLGYEYPCRILQQRINNNQLNVLHVPKAQKTIFDAHSSPTYGINICSSCRDKGRAIVHELMALAGFADDAFNERVDSAYKAWRDFGKVSDIENIKKIIRQKKQEALQEALDKITKDEFLDITDISIPASLKGKLDIEYSKENQFGSVKELEVILGETVEDIAIAYPVGMESFLRASEQARIISEREDLRDEHNKLKEYVPMLVATCNNNDTKLRQKAVDYLVFIIARCPAVPLDYVFTQFQLQGIEIKDDLQDAFRKAYLAEWSSFPLKAARLFDSLTKKEEMEMNLKEIAIFSNRGDFCEKNKQPGLADVAYTKAYYLFKWHIKELASLARDSLEKAELLTLNLYDKTKVEIEQAIEKMFVTISREPERFKALGIELDSVERAYANYCLAKEELKRVQGKIKKLIEGKESSIIDEPELARRDDIGQTLRIYRQRIEESKLIENDLEEKIRMLHGKFSEEILLASVEDRDFAKLNDDVDNKVRDKNPGRVKIHKIVQGEGIKGSNLFVRETLEDFPEVLYFLAQSYGNPHHPCVKVRAPRRGFSNLVISGSDFELMITEDTYNKLLANIGTRLESKKSGVVINETFLSLYLEIEDNGDLIIGDVDYAEGRHMEKPAVPDESQEKESDKTSHGHNKEENIKKAQNYVSSLLNSTFFKSLLEFFDEDPKSILKNKSHKKTIRTVSPYFTPKIVQAMIVGELGFNGEHILIGRGMEKFRHYGGKWVCVEDVLMIWERAGIVSDINFNARVGHSLDSEKFKAVSFTYINQEGKNTRQKILYSTEGIPDKEAKDEGWYRYLKKHNHNVHIFFCEDWSAAAHGYDIVKPALNKICYVLLDKKITRPELSLVRQFRYSGKERPLYIFDPNILIGHPNPAGENRQQSRNTTIDHRSQAILGLEFLSDLKEAFVGILQKFRGRFLKGCSPKINFPLSPDFIHIYRTLMSFLKKLTPPLFARKMRAISSMGRDDYVPESQERLDEGMLSQLKNAGYIKLDADGYPEPTPKLMTEVERGGNLGKLTLGEDVYMFRFDQSGLDILSIYDGTDYYLYKSSSGFGGRKKRGAPLIDENISELKLAYWVFLSNYFSFYVVGYPPSIEHFIEVMKVIYSRRKATDEEKQEAAIAKIIPAEHSDVLKAINQELNLLDTVPQKIDRDIVKLLVERLKDKDAAKRKEALAILFQTRRTLAVNENVTADDDTKRLINEIIRRAREQGSAYISVIVATMFILLSVIVAYLFPEISAQALKLCAVFGAPGNGAQLSSLAGFMSMLLFGGVAVDVGGSAMGIPVRYRVIGLEEMIESVRDLAKEFYRQVCIAKEYLMKVAFVRLPEVLGLGIVRKVEKTAVEIGRRFVPVILHEPSEKEQRRWSWAAFWALAEELPPERVAEIMGLVNELNERKKVAELSGKESPYQENTEINPLKWTPLVKEMEGRVRRIEELVKEVRGNYETVEVIGEGTVKAIEAGEINPEETLFVVSSPGRAYEYVRGKLTEFYRRQGVPTGEIESKVADHFMWIGEANTASAKKAGKMKILRRFNRAEGLLVLLALAGVNIKGFLEGVKKGMVMCREKDVNNNPGAQLLILQEVMKKAGRNRVFLVLPEELEEFVKAWRVMISLTGRESKGIIPILEGELASLASPGIYGKDTAFIQVTARAGRRSPLSNRSSRALASLRKAGYPVFKFPLGSEEDIGALFYIIAEFASVAGSPMGINQFRNMGSVETLLPVRQESEEASDSFGAEAAGLGIVTGQPLSKHGVKPEVKSMGKNLFVVHVENLLDIKSVREGTPFMMKMELEVTPGSIPVLEVMKKIIDAEKEGNLKKAGFVFVSTTRDVRTEVIKQMLTNLMIGAGLSREVVVRAIDSNLIIDEGELRGAGGIIRISGTPKISTRAVLSIINKRVEGRPDAGATAVRIITDKKNNWRNDVTKEMLGKVLWMVPEPAEESKGLSIKDGVAVAIEGSVPEWLRRLINSRYSKEKAKILLDQIERERTIILRAAPVVDEERLEEFEAQKWIYEIQV